MSFALTTQSIKDRTKDVTRRQGWGDLKPGERFTGIAQGQGLKKGEKQVVIAPVLECVSNRSVRIDSIPPEDCAREGFPKLTQVEFIAMYCRANRVTPDENCNRIEFRYIEEAERGE